MITLYDSAVHVNSTPFAATLDLLDQVPAETVRPGGYFCSPLESWAPSDKPHLADHDKLDEAWLAGYSAATDEGYDVLPFGGMSPEEQIEFAAGVEAWFADELLGVAGLNSRADWSDAELEDFAAQQTLEDARMCGFVA